jgi:hypothetical protein
VISPNTSPYAETLRNLSPLLNTTGLALVAWFVKKIGDRAHADAKDARDEVATVKESLATTSTQTAQTLSSIKKTGEANHKLSNSATGAFLKGRVDDAEESAIDKHRIAEMSQAPGDLAAAQAADRRTEQRKALLATHVQQQAEVDAVTQVIQPTPP